MFQENSNYSLQDYWASGIGSPNTNALKLPVGAEYLDLATGIKYRKTTGATTGTGWSPATNAEENGQRFYEDFDAWSTTDQIVTLTATGLVAAATANLLHYTWTPGGLRLGTVPLGGQTIQIAANTLGLDVSGDQVDNDGWEIFSHFAGATGRPFVVGQAAFYFETSIVMANVSGCDTMLLGLRKAAVNNGTYTSYLDYVAFGWDAAAAAVTVEA